MAITLLRKDNSSGVHQYQVRLADGKSHKDDPLFFFLDVGHFKVFIEYGSILLLFHGWGRGEFVLFFGCEACGILPPQPGIKPMPPALPLEGEVLVIRQPRQSPDEPLWKPGHQ